MPNTKGTWKKYPENKEFSEKDDNSRKWAEELCRNILEDIELGNIVDYWKKFDRVECLTECYFPAYLIAEPYVKAWYKVLKCYTVYERICRFTGSEIAFWCG